MASEFRGIEVFGKQPSNPRPRGRKSRRRAPESVGHARLGLIAFGAAVVTVLGTWLGIVASMADRFETGTVLAWLATVTSVIAVFGGAAAILLGRGRTWGVIALVFGLLASPPLLTRLLDWASGLG